jgi:hypothetical protein
MDAVDKGEEMDHLMNYIQGYTLMWPAKCNKEFEEEVRQNQEEALVVVLSFYASTWQLMSENVCG